jgi:hypothetical protein
MPEDAVDELRNRQRLGLGEVIAVVGVVEGHARTVALQRSVLGQRTTFDVASQIQGDAATVFIDVADLDIEVLAIEEPDNVTPVRAILLGRQGQPLLAKQCAELAEELATEQSLQWQGGDGHV